MTNKFVLTVDELIEEGFLIKYGIPYSVIDNDHNEKWNDICHHFDFCQYESSSENWTKEDVEDMLKDDPNRLDFLALKSLMEQEKQKEVLIIRD